VITPKDLKRVKGLM